jgi:hypothetical protein
MVNDLFSDEERELLSRMASVNSNGGVVHPILHIHPISRRPTAFLHLAMTGAVVHVGTDGERTALTRGPILIFLAPAVGTQPQLPDQPRAPQIRSTRTRTTRFRRRSVLRRRLHCLGEIARLNFDDPLCPLSDPLCPLSARSSVD